MNKDINFLWIGNNIPTIVNICLKSFYNKGHNCLLWIFDNKINNIPKYVKLMNANDIVSYEIYDKWFGINAKKPIDPKRKKIVQSFSDYFRYKLLYEVGGWWCDTDIFCLKYFDFNEPYVLAWADWPVPWMTEDIERVYGHRYAVQSGVMKMPPQSAILKEIIEEIENDVILANYPIWTSWIKCLTLLPPKYDLVKYVNKNPIFDPLGQHNWRKLYEQESIFIPDWAYSVHGYTSNGIQDIKSNSFLGKQLYNFKLV